MAAGFTDIDHDCLEHANLTSQDTAVTFTPTIGDILQLLLMNNTTEPTITNGTWQLLDSQLLVAGSTHYVFRCTAGGSSGVLNIASSDNWADTVYAIVRPTDLTYVGVAGKGVDNAGAGSLTISLTTSSPAALLALGVANLATATFAPDPGGWTELVDDNVPSGRSQQVQYRLSDDTECIIDPSGTPDIGGIVLEFDAAGGGSAASLTASADAAATASAAVNAVRGVAASVGAQSSVAATMYAVVQVNMGEVLGLSEVTADIQVQRSVAEFAPNVTAASDISASVFRLAHRDADVASVSDVSVALSLLAHRDVEVGAAAGVSALMTVVQGTTPVRGKYAAEHRRAYQQVKRAGGL